MRLLLTLSMLLAAAATAQPVPPLTAAKVIEKSIEASGGRAAMEKLSSTHAKGTMEFQPAEMHGAVEIYAKAPNRQLVVSLIEGLGEIRQGFDGQVAWSQDAGGDITELSGAALEDLKRSSTFNAALKWQELFPKAELAGEEDVDGRRAYIVKLTSAAGKQVTHYYDAGTFLLLREKGVRDTPQGPMDITADFSDYRDVGGLKVPFRTKQVLPMAEIVVVISEVQTNVAIPDSLFAKPAAK
jgi:zinc protease